MSILIAINLLNYMDRFTVAGVLTNIQTFFGINDADAGLLQTIYMIFFMLASPIYGFFGDRYNRKYIMTAGLTLWTSTVLVSTFVPKNTFWLFLFLRGVVGAGEASYSTIAPSVIADMFAGSSRSRMLMLFYFAIPCGSGLGFIIATRVAAITGDWTWGVRITVFLGIACVALIYTFVKEPERGAAEREKGEIAKSLKATSYCEDLKWLTTNMTYIFGTAAYTAIVFMVGTLSWWAPTTIEHSVAHEKGLNSTDLLPAEDKARQVFGFIAFSINLIFGALTCVGGIVGVGLGSVLSMLLRNGVGPFKHCQTVRSDPIICGVGALIGVPTLYFSLHLIPVDLKAAWVCLHAVDK
ncbi:unnamed protein product [Strongylus vulgaris]|uniref:Major facilitator superfamily (MFS) profile domain-containing protein n=1 Tax=Strongylus vulgaris TaxID=40348 RepID=A0A3P7IGG1_STRVU|nr:unnamed protein product [Strongylus vulgaris]